VAVECTGEGEGVPFDVDGTPILLRGRIDRIDHNPSTGEWAVLDYKTGQSVDPPEKAHRRGRGEDRRWIDLQLPLYRRLLSGILDDEGRRVIDVDLEGPGRSLIRFGFVSLPQDVENSAFMIADWTAADFASAEDAAREAVRLLRRARFEFDPEVTRATGSKQDALDPLLAVGWQSTGEQEDSSSMYAEDAGAR